MDGFEDEFGATDFLDVVEALPIHRHAANRIWSLAVIEGRRLVSQIDLLEALGALPIMLCEFVSHGFAVPSRTARPSIT
jgi:hypothetical protein